MGRRVVTAVGVVLAVGFVAAGVVLALRGGTGARGGLLWVRASPPPPSASPPGPSRGRRTPAGQRGDRTPRWALVAGYGRLRSCAGGPAALGVALVPVGLLLDGLRAGAAVRDRRRREPARWPSGAVAGVLLARGLALTGRSRSPRRRSRSTPDAFASRSRGVTYTTWSCRGSACTSPITDESRTTAESVDRWNVQGSVLVRPRE